MDGNIVTLTRNELYQMVWSTPLTQLAERLGTTGTALARACDDHQIPRPATGYWSRLRFGQKDEQPPLPEVPQSDTAIHIQPRAVASAASLPAGHDEPSSCPAVKLPDRLTSLHRLVAAAHRQLDYGKPDRDGLVRTDIATAVDICVSKKSIRRAVRIFEAIVRAWERDGGTVEGEKEQGTKFRVGPDSVCVRILERKTRVPPRNGDGDNSSRWSPTTYRATSELGLYVKGVYGARLRSEWKDPQAAIETVLDNVLDALRRHVEQAKLSRLDDECEQRQKTKAEEQRAARKERIRQERTDRRRLLKDARNWQRAEQIRAYLAALSRAVEQSSAEDGPAHREWMEWANWVVAKLDPLVRVKPAAPPSHAIPEPVNMPAVQLDLTRRGRRLIEELGIVDTDALYLVTEDQLQRRGPSYGLWNEICRVLEGLRYDVSDREFRR